MLRFRVCMEFSPQVVDEAAQVLRSLVGPVRAEPGCTATQLLRQTGEMSCALAYLEEWRGLDEFVQHLRLPSFKKIVAVMELAAGAPVVEIDEIVWRRGFDLVEEILDQARATPQRDGMKKSGCFESDGQG